MTAFIQVTCINNRQWLLNVDNILSASVVAADEEYQACVELTLREVERGASIVLSIVPANMDDLIERIRNPIVRTP